MSIFFIFIMAAIAATALPCAWVAAAIYRARTASRERITVP